MKVRELIEILEGIPQGSTVFLADEAEGSKFAEAVDFDVCYVRKSEVVHGRTDGLLYDEDLDELSPDEIRDDLEEVTVLWAV